MKIFYWDYNLNEGIEEPIKVDLQTALNLFYEVTEEPNNFFCVIDDNQKAIQFLCLDDDKWLVDIPSPPNFNNYQIKTDLEGCAYMIKEVFKQNRILIFEGMQRVQTKV